LEYKDLDKCSIGLYAINLIRNVVPEKHTQRSNWNHRIRRLTLDGVAFDASGKCFKAKPSQAVSSFLVKHSRIFDEGFCYPIGVMY